MNPKLALAFDQFVDWVVDCMVRPAVRTVGGTGILTILASLSAWVDSLKLALVVGCFGTALTCALALSMWLLFLCCRYVQNRSMGKVLSFDEALAKQTRIDPAEVNVLRDDDALQAGVELCYADFMSRLGVASIVTGAEALLRSLRTTR